MNFTTVVPAFLVVLALVGCAERQSASQSSTEGMPQKTETPAPTGSSVLTGCLTKGEAPGVYTLTDPKTGTKTKVVGTADLDKHSANHSVTLTGSRNDEGRFVVTAIQHLGSCGESH